jgi:hypothetical protein
MIHRVIVSIDVPDVAPQEPHIVALAVEKIVSEYFYYNSSPWDVSSALPLRPPVAR